LTKETESLKACLESTRNECDQLRGLNDKLVAELKKNKAELENLTNVNQWLWSVCSGVTDGVKEMEMIIKKINEITMPKEIKVFAKHPVGHDDIEINQRAISGPLDREHGIGRVTWDSRPPSLKAYPAFKIGVHLKNTSNSDILYRFELQQMKTHNGRLEHRFQEKISVNLNAVYNISLNSGTTYRNLSRVFDRDETDLDLASFFW